MLYFSSYFYLGVEVKSGNTLSKIKEGAKQNKEGNQLLGRWHRDILSPDWTYERVVALPMVESLPTFPHPICASCEPYVLDGSRLKKGLRDWLAGSQPAPHPVDHQYEILLTRNQFNSFSTLKKKKKSTQALYKQAKTVFQIFCFVKIFSKNLCLRSR